MSRFNTSEVNDVHEASEKGDASVVAIIDTGIDILHEAFLDETGEKTRIIAIWDQTDDTGSSPQIPGIPNLGTEHTEEKINEYLKNQLVPPKLGRDPNGHGTHVASITAGKPGKHFLGGIAPEAKIILVKPRIQSNSGDQFSLGYSHTHGLALIYIKYIAQREDLPVVVNVSQGMNAGAHDGTSLLELCFDNFSGGGRDCGFIIVKSAGNERNQKNHAQFSIAKDSADSLCWNSEPVCRQKDVIELWFKACNLFRFRLKNPSGESSGWVTADENLRDRFSSGNSFSISYIRYHKDNGDSRFLLTIAPGVSGLIEEKEWVLEIESILVENPEEIIHAWIEKDPNRSISFTNHLSENVTLSIPGTAKTVISVGSVNTSKPFRIAEYSSYGPTRDGRHQPDVSAPGENISAALSGSSDGIRTMSGTSMAAPHVTGSIALLLSARRKKCVTQQGLDQFNAAQVRSAICNITQNFSGQWHSGMGYGVLDAMNLMKTLNCI